MLTVERAATLALLLEATADPKPGNVDRGHDHDDVGLGDFVASAVAVGPAVAAAGDVGVGAAVERAARAMAVAAGTNTHFGAALLLAPIAAAADRGDAPLDGAAAAVDGTTVEDAVRFYAAFDHVEVGLPPLEAEGPLAGLDARDPAARDRVRDRGLTLADVMAASSGVDGIAREWSEAFPRTARAADRLERHHDPGAVDGVERAVAATYLDLLAGEPDTAVAKRHGVEVAREVRERAAAVRDEGRDPAAVAAFDEELVERGVNPGTTADLVAGGLYVALRRDGGFRP